MTFNNHCNTTLYNEAKKLIAAKTDWHHRYKKQTLNEVEDVLERGRMIRTEHGGYTVEYSVANVSLIVDSFD